MGRPAYWVVNEVTTDRGEIRWNGVPIDEERLVAYLKLAARMDPVPFLVFEPGNSNCKDAKRVRDLIDRNYPCGDGACGQGARAEFDAAPSKETNRPPA